MGLDRIADHQQAGTEVLTAPDMSCLMHLDGLLRRQGSNDARDAHRPDSGGPCSSRTGVQRRLR